VIVFAGPTMSGNAPSPIRLDVEKGVARITFDLPGDKLNKLSREVMGRLADVLSELESRGDIRGAVIGSGKDGMFLAGADVSEFQSIDDLAAATDAIHAGQTIMDRIESLPFPVVAAIGGVCLGGGTEIALACDARLGSDHPRFQIGLPEVQLGILPAWGGTTRLPRLIGLPQALDFILRGRGVDAKRALRMGLIDRRVAHAELEPRALELLEALIAGERSVRSRRSWRDRLLAGNPVGRWVLFSQARKKVLSQTRGHYPAPLAVLEVLRRGRRSKARSLALECEHASRLLISDVSKNLVRLFFSSEAAKKPRGETEDATAPPVEHAAIVGAGTMGGGIARLFAARELPVRLKDIHPDAVGQGLRAAREIFEKRFNRRRLSRWEVERQMALISPTLDYSGFGRADVVVEAVVEELEVKKLVLKELETVVSEDAILASNTSTLSVSEMQSGLSHPARMAGFHFFNPVDRMPLVEIIRGRATSEETISRLVSLARKLGKTPVVVNDGPGFLVNRILGPYLNEAGHLLSESGDIAGIDDALVEFGMPMGPLRLLDEIGLDVALKAGNVLAAAFGEHKAPSPVLGKLVAADRLGKKNGRGFYRHPSGRKGKEAPDATALAIAGVDRRRIDRTEVLERCLSVMVSEAALALADGTVDSPGELDLALIMGTGFPPFRGGLLRYADGYGIEAIVDVLSKWKEQHGDRFTPPENLRGLRSFY